MVLWKGKAKGGDSNNNTIDQEITPKEVVTSSAPTCSSTEEFSWFSQPADKPRVHGFENKVLSLKKLIRERESERHFKAVGVFGPRGVGKTTLCQVYYYGDNLLVTREQQPKDEKNEATTDKESQKTFFPRVWIPMSKIPDEIELMKRMLEKLGVQEEKVTNIINSAPFNDGEKLSALLYVLRLQLTGKRYLVVLDDVQEEESLAGKLVQSLTCALPKWSGGTVLVTTREKKMAKRIVDEGNVLHVLPLSDRNSLKEIFKDEVIKNMKLRDQKFDMEKLKQRIETFTPKELFRAEINVIEVLEDKVVDKCNGLPLAAILMAKTMPDQLTRKEREKEEKEKEKEKKGNIPQTNQENVGNESEGTATSQTPLKTEGEQGDEEEGKASETSEHAQDPQVKGGESDTVVQKKEEMSQEKQETKPDESANSEKDDTTEELGEGQAEERSGKEAEAAQKKEDKKVDETKAQAVPSTKGNDESSKNEAIETPTQRKDDKQVQGEAIQSKDGAQVQEEIIKKKDGAQVQEQANRKKDDVQVQEEVIKKKDDKQVQGEAIKKKEDAQVQGEAIRKKDDAHIQEEAIQKKEDAQVQGETIKKKDVAQNGAQVQEQAIKKKDDSQVQEEVIKNKEGKQVQGEAIKKKEDAQVQGEAIQKKEGAQVQEQTSPEKALLEEKPDQNVKEEAKISTEEAVSKKGE